MTVPDLTVSLEEANAYFAGRLYADKWIEASETDRRKSLVWSASLIRTGFLWSSSAYSGTEWNTAVISAVCEEALWLIKRDPTDYPAVLTKGVRRMTAGFVSAELDPGLTSPLICSAAEEMIGGHGTRIWGKRCIVSTLL